MSFDIVAFDPRFVPRRKNRFKTWLHLQMGKKESGCYDDITVSSPILRCWYVEMIKDFPAMKRMDSISEEQLFELCLPEDHLADYTIHQGFICASFNSLAAELAWEKSCCWAEEYGVALYAIRDDIIYKFSPKRYLAKKDVLIATMILALKILTISGISVVLLIMLAHLVGVSANMLALIISSSCAIPLILIAYAIISFYWMHYGIYEAIEKEKGAQIRLIEDIDIKGMINQMFQIVKLPCVNLGIEYGRNFMLQTKFGDYHPFYGRKDFFSIVLPTDNLVTDNLLLEFKGKCEGLGHKKVKVYITKENLFRYREDETVLKITMPRKITSVALVKEYLDLLYSANKKDKNVFVKKYDEEEGITYYIHFHDNYAVRQIELFADGKREFYSLTKDPFGLTDIGLRELEEKIKLEDYITREEFQTCWREINKKPEIS